jgi:hypothetical protein
MERMNAALLGVLAGIAALHLLGFAERFAKLMVAYAMALLPRPLRDRVMEECHSEIEDMRGEIPKLYIGFTCFLDAVRLERMWRTERICRLMTEREKPLADRFGRTLKRDFDGWDKFSDLKEGQDFPTVEVAGNTKTESQDAPLHSFSATLKTRLSLLMRPNPYKPENRGNQKLLLMRCGGKVWRLDGGMWVKDW